MYETQSTVARVLWKRKHFNSKGRGEEKQFIGSRRVVSELKTRKWGVSCLSAGYVGTVVTW